VTKAGEFASRVVSSLRQSDFTSGAVLLSFGLLAIVVANSSFGPAVQAVLTSTPAFTVPYLGMPLTVQQLVNEGLMALFFLSVGLEMKREMLYGHLATVRKALLPVVAALGGMLGPALTYLLFNPDLPNRNGWAIPTATDIAFSLAVAALAGPGFTPSMRAFLLTLAVADDVGGVLEVAVFYHTSINALWLLAALGLSLGVYFAAKRWQPADWVFLVAGCIVWYSLLHAGIHPALAGILIALTVPLWPVGNPLSALDHDGEPENPLAYPVPESRSSLGRLEHALSGVVAYVVLPLFAFANLGVRFDMLAGASLGDLRVMFGIAAALVVGVPVGVTVSTWIGVRMGLGELPQGVLWRDIAGVGVIAGVAFSVALLIASAAFSEKQLVSQAQCGILLGSCISASVGICYFRIVRRPGSRHLSTSDLTPPAST